MFVICICKIFDPYVVTKMKHSLTFSVPVLMILARSKYRVILWSISALYMLVRPLNIPTLIRCKAGILLQDSIFKTNAKVWDF